MNSHSLLRVKDLSVVLQGRRILHSIDLEVRHGERIALVGPNGGGKTTLLRALSGAISFCSGSITLNGYPYIRNRKWQPRNVLSMSACIPQGGDLVGRLPVWRNILTGTLHRRPFWRSALDIVSKEELSMVVTLAQELGIEHKLRDRVDELSGGQRSRTAIARALAQQPIVLFADEPTANLDPHTQTSVMSMLCSSLERGVSAILASLHNIEHSLTYFDRILCLRQGKLTLDEPTAELTSADVEQHVKA